MQSIQRPAFALHGEGLQRLRRHAARWLVRTAFGRSGADADVGPLPRAGIHRILVCHVSHTLGNTLLLTPLLRELQQVYPGAEVDIVTRSAVADEVFGAFACVRRIFRVPRRGLAAPWRIIGLLRSLRARRYDLAIDPCLRSQSDRLGVLAAKATWKLGYVAAGKSGSLSHGVAAPNAIRHIGQLPVYLLRTATGRSALAPYPPLDICLCPSERALGVELLSRLVAEPGVSASPIIGLFTNATGTKHLGAEWWSRFAERLAERNRGHRIVEIVPVSGTSLLGERCPTFYSSDLRRLACVLSALSMFVSADCGVMHLACASGTPTTGLFAGTDVGEWGPYGPHDKAIEIGTRAPQEIADLLTLTSEISAVA